MRARQVWLKVHRWMGLTIGLFFVLLGLTGSLLVFDHAIDEWLNPHLLLTPGAGSQRNLAETIEAAQAAYPELGQPVLISPPRRPDGNYTLRYQFGSDPHEAERIEVYVDPFNAQVQGRRVWGRYPMSWIYKLHFTLHGGEWGHTAVGILGLLLILSLTTGLYLWWPLLRKGMRTAFAIRRNKLLFDGHKTIGAVSFLILGTTAFTGIYMTLPWLVKPAVTSLSPETPLPKDLKSTPSPNGKPITADRAVAIASEIFLDGTFGYLRPPQDAEGVYVVGMRRAGEVRQTGALSGLWIDQYSGDVLAIRNWQDFTAADTFFACQFPLHNGEAFGLAGRWMIFCAGIVPAVLYLTGFLLWRRKSGTMGIHTKAKVTGAAESNDKQLL